MNKPIEVTLLVENHPCEVMATFQKLNINAKIDNVKLREDVTDHVAELGTDNEKAIEELKKASLKILRISKEKIWIRTNGCAVCKLLYHNDVIVEKVKVVGNKSIVYTLMLPYLSMKKFLQDLNNIGVKTTVINVSEIDSEELTERQMEILKLAYKLGYFDVDRKISLKDLAEKLGISIPTLEEILRRALKKAIRYYIKHNE
jgi:predicted DNA binding protein